MLHTLQANSKELVAIGGVLLAFVLNRVFRLRAKLTYSIRHSFNFIVEEPLKNEAGEVLAQKQMIRTASIFSHNIGLSPAKGVEFTFNWKPPVFNVWPARHYSEHPSAVGRHTIRLDSLAPGETFAMEILSINSELPLLTAVRSDDVEGKLVPMTPQRDLPTWARHLITLLLLAGLAETIYLAAFLVQWLAS